MRKLKTIIPLFLLIGCATVTSSIHNNFKLESVSIYVDTLSRGFTTASAVGHFKVLEGDNVQLVKLSNKEIKLFKECLNTSKIKKHKQTKLGQGILFCEMLFENNKLHKFIITIGES